MLKNLRIVIAFFFGLIVTSPAFALLHNYTRTADGVIITLPAGAECASMRLEVLSERIIHVLAFPASATMQVSLMAVQQNRPATNFTLKEQGTNLQLRTA